MFMNIGTQNKWKMLIINKLELITLTQNYKYAKFSLETEICSDFYEICHSQQIKHANYEYNTRKCLEHMIIGSK